MRLEDPPTIEILHIFGRMARGGAEMRTLELLQHVDQKRFRFEFCALSGRSGELDDEIRALGGAIHYVGLGPLFLLRFPALLWRRRFRVVHSHVHLFSGFILLLAALARIPVRVAHFRSTNDGQVETLRRRVQNRLMKYLLDCSATKIVAVSAGAMASAWGEDWQSDPRCEVVYSGLDFARFASVEAQANVRQEFGLADNCSLFIHVGRMVPAKNHEKIITVFQQILQRDPMARLLLVGRGGNGIESKLRQLCEQHGMLDKVVFAGERIDVPRLLMAADLLLFPSRWEGLPGAVLEACAAGTPTLASDLPGVREIKGIVPGVVTALPVDADDSQWAQAAIEICARKLTPAQKEAVSRSIATSDFAISRSLAKLTRAWTYNLAGGSVGRS